MINKKKKKIQILLYFIVLVIISVGFSIPGSISAYKDEALTEQNIRDNVISSIDRCIFDNGGLENRKAYDDCLLKEKIESTKLSNDTMSRGELVLQAVSFAIVNLIPSVIIVITYFFMQMKPRNLRVLSDWFKFVGINTIILGIGVIIDMGGLMITTNQIADVYNISKFNYILITMLITLIGALFITQLDTLFRTLYNREFIAGCFPVGKRKKTLNQLVDLNLNFNSQLGAIDTELKLNDNLCLGDLLENKRKSRYIAEATRFINLQIQILTDFDEATSKEFLYIQASAARWTTIREDLRTDTYISTVQRISAALYRDVNFASSEFDRIKRKEKKVKSKK